MLFWGGLPDHDGFCTLDDTINTRLTPPNFPPRPPKKNTHSVRRGFQVYREVCASCHAMEHTYFRNLVGATHTEEEVKKIAESYDVVDGPNAEGVRALSLVSRPRACVAQARHAAGSVWIGTDENRGAWG
jgi:cytochrome c1